MTRRLILTLVLTVAIPSLASAQQDFSKAVIKTFDLDTVTSLLQQEGLKHELVLKMADKHVAIFERTEGTTLVGGRQVPLIRVVTFHFEKARTGTRVIATEELVARQPGGAETPIKIDINSRATDLQDLLLAAKAKSMPAGAAPDSSASSQ
ncbi:MAG: hypothetical protein ABJC74_14100 [Gemmatimonadota bacterium]